MALIEFVVLGPPVSSQTRDKANLRAWKERIRDQAIACWGATPQLTGKLKCTVINFHVGEAASLDDDNMVKPIRDAMSKCIYADDRQITYSETIQVSIDSPMRIRRASPVLLNAFSAGGEFVYIRLDELPNYIQLPE